MPSSTKWLLRTVGSVYKAYAFRDNVWLTFSWQFEISAYAFKSSAFSIILQVPMLTYDSKEEVTESASREGAQSLHLSEPKKAHPTSEFVVVA